MRRELPALTDPRLLDVACAVDEAARTFVLRRGSDASAVVIVVNFSAEPVTVGLGEDITYAVRWATPSGATVRGSAVELPPHVGALLVPAVGR